MTTTACAERAQRGMTTTARAAHLGHADGECQHHVGQHAGGDDGCAVANGPVAQQVGVVSCGSGMIGGVGGKGEVRCAAGWAHQLQRTDELHAARC